MHNEPSGTDLLVEVAKALRAGLAPGFEQKVAANAVDLAERERTLAPAHETAEADRLRALLGRDGDLEALRTALCDAIRNGRFATDDPALLAHLHASAAEKLAIDNPAYPAFKNNRPDFKNRNGC